MRRLLRVGLAVAVAMTAVAGCQRPAEHTFIQVIYRNDSDTAYIVGLAYPGNAPEGDFVAPAHSRAGSAWDSISGPTAVRVYTLGCEKVSSIDLTAKANLLEISAGGKASVLNLDKQAEPSPSVLDLGASRIGNNTPYCNGSWYVGARNDSDQQVSITLSGYSGSWVVSAHTRSELAFGPASTFDSSRRVTIYTTGCQLLGDAGSLPTTAYVGIDAGGRFSLMSPDDFWVTTSAHQDVSLVDLQSVNPCVSTGPGNSGNP